MKIVITGSSGLIGSAVVPRLRSAGHQVLRLVRSSPGNDPEAMVWNPERGELNAQSLEGIDGVLHLAGEPLDGRWTSEKKNRILESRVQSTQLLCRTLAKLAQRPQVVVSASAVGYYGNRGDERLDENSPPGTGFLATVCQQWEKAAEPARQHGIRVVHPRLAIVLSAKGGALGRSLPPFRMGMGGILGSGRQYWSWILLEDAVALLQQFLEEPFWEGPVNVATPEPATNQEFTRTLSRVLQRPAPLKVPAFALRMLMGSMADELILASARVEPAKLKASGYAFQHTDLEDALRHCIAGEQVHVSPAGRM